MNIKEWFQQVAYLKFVPINGIDVPMSWLSKFDDSYITFEGLEDGMKFLLDRGITEELSHGLGFSPKHNKWYGWSHRAICGFGIGSLTKLDDCSFNPSCKEEMEQSMLSFWDCSNPHLWRECEEETVVCKNRLMRSCQTRENGTLGWLIAYDTIFIGADRYFSVNQRFSPFPDKWGKGEWVAETLDDAKQMAIDFCEGVS